MTCIIKVSYFRIQNVIYKNKYCKNEWLQDGRLGIIYDISKTELEMSSICTACYLLER